MQGSKHIAVVKRAACIEKGKNSSVRVKFNLTIKKNYPQFLKIDIRWQLIFATLNWPNSLAL